MMKCYIWEINDGWSILQRPLWPIKQFETYQFFALLRQFVRQWLVVDVGTSNSALPFQTSQVSLLEIFTDYLRYKLGKGILEYWDS